jgi:hypothetical protein
VTKKEKEKTKEKQTERTFDIALQITQVCPCIDPSSARSPKRGRARGGPSRPKLACPDPRQPVGGWSPWREAKATSISRCNACAGLAILRQSFAQGRQIAYAVESAAEICRMPPLALTDAQLDAVFRACAPLQPHARAGFLEAVAAALQGREIGDGSVGRAIAAAQRQFFDAPLSTDERAEPHHRGPNRRAAG